MQIGIAAHSSPPTQQALKKAREFLEELKSCCGNATLILGGYWGFMRDIADEALRLGFKLVFILPIEREDVEVPEGSIVIKSGCDFRCRSVILVRSSDVLACLGGGAGTMIEAFISYVMGKPTYILIDTGMSSDILKQAFPKCFDDRCIAEVRYFEDPREMARALCRERPIRKVVSVG